MCQPIFMYKHKCIDNNRKIEILIINLTKNIVVDTITKCIKVNYLRHNTSNKRYADLLHTRIIHKTLLIFL